MNAERFGGRVRRGEAIGCPNVILSPEVPKVDKVEQPIKLRSASFYRIDKPHKLTKKTMVRKSS